jgi:Zn-dependent protease with chaperone function
MFLGGLLFDESTGPAGLAVNVRVSAVGLTIERPGGLDLEFADVTLGLRWGGTDGDRLVVEDVPPREPARMVFVEDVRLLEALELSGSRRLTELARQLRGQRRRGRVFGGFGWVVAALLLAAALLELYRGSPYLIELTVRAVPHSWEVSAGKVLVGTQLATRRKVTDATVTRAIETISGRLSEALRNRPYPFEFHVVSDDQANAFAVPGGQIVVMSGLLREAVSAEEVAGVLAHEMQHVLQRHSLRALARQLGLAATLGLLVGDVGALTQLGSSLLSSKFSREQEAAADREGARLLLAAGLPLEPMAAFFDRMAGKAGQAEKAFEYFSSHPASMGRAAAIRALAKELAPAAPPRPLDLDWPAVQRALSAVPDAPYTGPAGARRP